MVLRLSRRLARRRYRMTYAGGRVETNLAAGGTIAPGGSIAIVGERFADVNLEHAIARRAAIANQADLRYQRG
jgi:hypothetical protein